MGTPLQSDMEIISGSSSTNYSPLIPPQQTSNSRGVSCTNLHQMEVPESTIVTIAELAPEPKPYKIESIPSGNRQIPRMDDLENSNSSNSNSSNLNSSDTQLIPEQTQQREYSVDSNSTNPHMILTPQLSLVSTTGQIAELENLDSSKSNSSELVEVAQQCNTGSIAVSCVGKGSEKKALYKSGQRSSNFRGVTKHRWTGKFEAHLWDNTVLHEGRKRKGKQVYLGGYDSELKAAQAYDLAALKYWGPSASTKLNFPISEYEKELEEMKNMSQDEYVNSIRRKSICFTRGQSKYRGVTRQHEGRRWQARIGRVAGGKDIYLGTYDTQEEAAEAYDIAAVKLRGMNAITNFDISNYYKEGTKELDVIPINCVGEGSSTMRIRYFKLT